MSIIKRIKMYLKNQCDGFLSISVVFAIGIIAILGLAIKALQIFIQKSYVLRVRHNFIYKCRHWKNTMKSINPENNHYKAKGRIKMTTIMHENISNNITTDHHHLVIYNMNKDYEHGLVRINVDVQTQKITYYYNNDVRYQESFNKFLLEMHTVVYVDSYIVTNIYDMKS